MLFSFSDYQFIKCLHTTEIIRGIPGCVSILRKKISKKTKRVHLKCQTKYRESIYTTLGAYYSFAPHSFLTTIRVESVNVL